MKNIQTKWDDKRKILRTTLSGEVNEADIIAWENGLYEEAEKIPAPTQFKVIIDFRNYKSLNIPIHQKQRKVMPYFLRKYGHKVAFVKLYNNESSEHALSGGLETSILKVAHIHHDVEKMRLFEEQIGNERERFFSDLKAAEAWIEANK